MFLLGLGIRATSLVASLKDDLGMSVSRIQLEGSNDPSPCVVTGKPATKRVVFAKAY